MLGRITNEVQIRVPSATVIDLMDDVYADHIPMLYNCMVILLYENQAQYAQIQPILDDKTFIFTRTERVHHLLHVVKGSSEYDVKNWRSSAGNQFISQHPHIKNALQSLIAFVDTQYE